jgi:muconate cycloisomerase
VSRPKGTAGPDIAGNYYTDDIITEAFRFEGGRVYRPAGPGLGIEVDEDKIAAYAL